jgi:hypothetical protein
LYASAIVQRIDCHSLSTALRRVLVIAAKGTPGDSRGAPIAWLQFGNFGCRTIAIGSLVYTIISSKIQN